MSEGANVSQSVDVGGHESVSERVRERQQRYSNVGAILRRPQLACPLCITIILLEVLLLISALFHLMTWHALILETRKATYIKGPFKKMQAVR